MNLKLAVINKAGKVVKVYQDGCTVQQIDHVFDDYIKLRSQASMAPPKKPPQKVPRLEGPELDKYMSAVIFKALEEYEARREFEGRLNSIWRKKLAIKKNNIAAFFKNAINWILRRKGPKTK